MTTDDHGLSAGQGRARMPGQVWLRPEPARREPLSRDRIVHTALALLDEEGADRLTMRRLAERVGSGLTTLYGHVRTKDDVLDLALDAVYAEIQVPEPAEDWREEVAGLMRAWREALVRHPWSARLLGRPQLGPHMLAREERLYALLAGAGLTSPRLQDAVYALSNYVIGSVLMQISWQEQEPATRQGATAYIHANRETYPALVAHRSDTDTDWKRSFDTGLRYLLDGVTVDR